MLSDGDLDVSIEDPSGRTIFQISQTRRHRFDFKTEHSGPYKLCFFSRLSAVSNDKIVYMSWSTENDNPHRIMDRSIKKLVDRSIMPSIHSGLDYLANQFQKIDYYQTQHRLKEVIERKRVENISNYVSYSSMWNIALVLLVGICEVTYLDLLI